MIPPRPATRQPAANGSTAGPTDFSLPMPTQRPGAETPEPGSRANWPLLNAEKDEATRPDLPSRATPPSRSELPSRSAPSRSDLPSRSDRASRSDLPSRPTSSRPSPSAAPVSSPSGGRVRPPWQDMPDEPAPLQMPKEPALRLVDQARNGTGRARLPGLDQLGGTPPLRVVDEVERGGARRPPHRPRPSRAGSARRSAHEARRHL